MYPDNRFKTQNSIHLHENTYEYPKFKSFVQTNKKYTEDIYDKLLIIFQDIIQRRKKVTSIFANTNQHLQRKESSIQKYSKIPENQKSVQVLQSTSVKQNFSSIKLKSFNSFSLASSGFSIFQQQYHQGLKSFESQYFLQKQHIQKLFSQDDQIVLIMSVGLICRYLYMNNKNLSQSTLLKLFCIGAILSYKISYDSDLPGIFNEFAITMNLNMKNLMHLQQEFLKGINYDININGKTLHYLMTWFN